MKKFKEICMAVFRFMRMVAVWCFGLLPLLLTAFLLRHHGLPVALLAGCGSEALVSLLIVWIYTIAGRVHVRRMKTDTPEP